MPGGVWSNSAIPLQTCQQSPPVTKGKWKGKIAPECSRYSNSMDTPSRRVAPFARGRVVNSLNKNYGMQNAKYEYDAPPPPPATQGVLSKDPRVISPYFVIWYYALGHLRFCGSFDISGAFQTHRALRLTFTTWLQGHCYVAEQVSVWVILY